MTIFDILYFNRELIEKLFNIGIRIDDYKYINVYADYQEMYNRGEKVSYIIAFLSKEYTVSERSIYYIVKRFGTCCNEHAVR